MSKVVSTAFVSFLVWVVFPGSATADGQYRLNIWVENLRGISNYEVDLRIARVPENSSENGKAVFLPPLTDGDFEINRGGILFTRVPNVFRGGFTRGFLFGVVRDKTTHEVLRWIPYRIFEMPPAGGRHDIDITGLPAQESPLDGFRESDPFQNSDSVILRDFDWVLFRSILRSMGRGNFIQSAEAGDRVYGILRDYLKVFPLLYPRQREELLGTVRDLYGGSCDYSQVSVCRNAINYLRYLSHFTQNRLMYIEVDGAEVLSQIMFSEIRRVFREHGVRVLHEMPRVLNSYMQAEFRDQCLAIAGEIANSLSNNSSNDFIDYDDVRAAEVVRDTLAFALNCAGVHYYKTTEELGGSWVLESVRHHFLESQSNGREALTRVYEYYENVLLIRYSIPDDDARWAHVVRHMSAIRAYIEGET